MQRGPTQMDDARARLKDLGDRIQAAMDRHGITEAELAVRRFRRRERELLNRMSNSHREVAHAINQACYSVREMSEVLLRLRQGMKRK